jgi:AbrB family looped-hinge helix DNA binding protein
MNIVNAHDFALIEGEATVTKRGQVAIPASVRRLLKVGPYDKVIFALDKNGGIQIVPAAATLESAYGSVRPVSRPEHFEMRSQEAKDEKAAQVSSDLASSV